MFRCVRDRQSSLSSLHSLGRVLLLEAEAAAAAAAAAASGSGRTACSSYSTAATASRGVQQQARGRQLQQQHWWRQQQQQQQEAGGARTFASSSSSSSARPPATSSAPVNYVSLALTLATGCGLLAYYSHAREKRLEELRGRDQQVVGAAMVGGPFEMVECISGKPFTDRDLRGQYALLYYGFTYCPDICPDELEKIAAAIDLVEKRVGARVTPVFLTVDPERDTTQQVKEYVREFHPRLVGLTGSAEQVKAAARAYRVYYSKTNDSPNDYLVDHSIITYLVDPEGKFVTFYGKNFEAEEIADSIAGHVATWRREHPEYDGAAQPHVGGGGAAGGKGKAKKAGA